MTATTVPDIINRPISVGDHVVYYGRVYQVQKLKFAGSGVISSVIIMLMNKTESTSAHEAYSRLCCRIPKEDMLMWALGKDYKSEVKVYG